MITTGQLKRIEELNRQGKSDPEIAKLIGASYGSVHHYRREVLGLPGHKNTRGSQLEPYRDEITRMCRSGKNDVEIAEEFGVSHSTVSLIRRDMGLPRARTHRRCTKKQYTVYGKYSGEYICEGTADEISAYIGIKKSTIYSVVTRSRTGKADSKYEIIEVTDDDE